MAVTPAAKFGARGPKFRLLFGQSTDRNGSPPLDKLIGLGWLYALNPRAAIVRGRPLAPGTGSAASMIRPWHSPADVSESSPTMRGRIDRLPNDVVAHYEHTLMRSLETRELRRSLELASEFAITEVGEADPELAEHLRAPLACALGR